MARDCISPLPSDPDKLNETLDDHVVTGRISLRDADAVREFAAFLREAGGLRPVPLRVLKKYQKYLGISDDEMARIVKLRTGEARAKKSEG